MNTDSRAIAFAFVLAGLSLGFGGGPTLLDAAEPAKPIPLKTFLGKTQYGTVGAEWILPVGRHVVEGVPFQIDGIVELAGSSARFSNVGRTKIESIPVGGTLERFYFLAAASRDATEGAALAQFNIRFADGTEASISIEYGRHVLDWMGARHKGEAPLIEPDARVAWQAEHPAAARRDDSLRLYYFTLANPSPAKAVESVGLVSAGARGGIMVAALTVGPERVDRLEDTLARVEEHFHLEGAEKPTLTGRVTDQTGKPVSSALVRVLSVRTVESSDSLTTADSEFVGREAKTDKDGRYRLEKLSERLLYQLMFVAPELQAAVFDRADPLAGPSNIRLLPGTNSTGEFLVRARLVGPDGKPVFGASVKPDGVTVDASTSWGGSQGFPSEVMTGPNGEFTMARDQTFSRMSVNIKATGLAPAKVWLPVSNGVHTIQMGVGAVLTGRVIKDGQPLFDVVVGVAGANRSSEVFAGSYTAKTDADGRFKFEHLPPGTEWFAYGQMASLRGDGSVPPRPVQTAGHGQSTDLGDLLVVPGVTLAGVVKTADNRPVPSGLRMTINLDSAWDSQTLRPDRDGKFEITGLHTGLVEISVGSQNWSLSPDNRSLDDWNPWRMMGQLTGDKRDLEILLENKPRNYNNSYISGNGNLPEQDRANARPLSGVEPSGPPPVVLAGVILDDTTGQLIPNVRIVPGRKPPGTGQPPFDGPARRMTPWNERIFWEYGRARTNDSGRFSVVNRALSSRPVLRFEAEGYDVFDTEPYAASQANLTIRLKKGFGPSGVLLGTNGAPVAGAAIAFAAEQEQFSVSPTGTLTVYSENHSRIYTAPDGRFAFPSRAGGRRVFATTEDGWANVAVKDWPADGRIRLTPWGKVTGFLHSTNGQAVTGVRLAIQMQGNNAEGDPSIYFQEQPATDARGRFDFQRVPAGELRLSYLIPMRRGGLLHAHQTNFTAQAGVSTDLGKLTQAPRPQGFDFE